MQQHQLEGLTGLASLRCSLRHLRARGESYFQMDFFFSKGGGDLKWAMLVEYYIN